ncbi:MAG: hypothetical protein KDK08_28555 [Rhizobiaceae bacterium]|nr:hypothetical protein [Rhizobiaceae bacterium]
MTTMDHRGGPGKSDPVRLPTKTRRPLLDFALPAVAVASGIMLVLATLALIEADGILDYAKALTLAFSASAVSYGVNKLAIDRGAPLGTTGYHGASLLSIASILAVGSGLFAATYSGLTLKDSSELQLREHGTALSAYVGERSGAASEAARVNPVIRAIEADLQQKAACEIQTSCISGRGNGGIGPVARVVQEYAGRATSIGQQIAAGDAARQAILGRLNADIAEYQTILGDDARDVSERRMLLNAVDTRIRQSVGDLNEAVPLSLLAAYAGELQSGVGIPGRPEAEARLNGILSRHGQSLMTVIGGIEDVNAPPPVFPGKTGVSDTFRYIGHFLPIAAIAAVVELVFPIVLWAYTFWALKWEKFKADPPAWAAEKDSVEARDAADRRELPVEPTPVPRPARHPNGNGGHHPHNPNIPGARR